MEKRKRTTSIGVIEKEPFGSPFVLALAVVGGTDLHAIYRIVNMETLVGRSKLADFCLSDDMISDEHIRIRVNNQLFSLVDLGSTNGTFVNGTKITEGTPIRLKNLDLIKIGKTTLIFLANRYRNE
jgi:pSer/pThr/pTyr-binding forkhead associated (FHA) protein